MTALRVRGPRFFFSFLRRSGVRADWRTCAAFGLPFTLYLFTLAPTIYNLDSAELTTAAATGGLTRATGYPLYLLLGHLWSRLPIGDAGFRMNLFSAFNGALTIALAERMLRRWGAGPVATFGALGLLACAPFFWALSLIAEVYTLHTALMAATLLLLLRWADNPTPRRLSLVALCIGLSLGHHAATALLLPGYAWFVVTTAPGRALAPRALIWATGGLLIGLSVYLYLPLRYQALPAFNYAGLYDTTGVFKPVNLQTPGGLWWLVSGRAFAGMMFAYRGDALWREAGWFIEQLWRAFFTIGVAPGLLGMGVLLRRNWRSGGTLLLLFASHTLFYIDYAVIDKDTMFLPSYVVWALWLGLGFQWLLAWVRDKGEARTQRWGARLLSGIMMGAVLLALAWNWRLVDQSDDWSARVQGETILNRVQPNALIFGWWDTVPVIQYLQLVEGWRPDVQAISRFLIAPGDMRDLIFSQIARRPIYIDGPSLEMIELVVDRIGPMYQLQLPERYLDEEGR